MNDRTQFLGASEVSAIVGLNPFCTPLKLYALKTKLILPEPETESQEWGKRLERVVSNKFSENHKVKLIARKVRYFHPKHGFISCELDNIIALTDELVEAKTVNAYDWKKWADPNQIPEYIIVQVMMQLGLAKRKKAWVACLCGGQKYIEKEILFDEEFYNMLVEKCIKFWDMVQNKVPPACCADDNETLLALYPKSDEQIQAMQEMNDCIATLQKTKLDIKELETHKDELEAKLKEVIKDNLGIKTSEYVVKWTPQTTSRLNYDALKEDGLYDKYLVKTETRRLTVNKNKEVQQ